MPRQQSSARAHPIRSSTLAKCASQSRGRLLMLEMAAIGIDVFAVSVLLKRQPAKSLDQSTGKYITTPAPVPETIRATVQPTSGKALRDLPEGLRNDAQYTMWTREVIANDDRVVHE